MERLLIGIDIGTSGTKTIIINERGRVVRSKTVEYDTIVLKPGWSEMQPERWWDAVVETLRDVTSGIDPAALCAVGFSGQMHGMLALDEDMNVVRPAILWNDVRNQAQCDEVTALAGGLEALLGYTNNRMLMGYTGGKILWMKENEPENYARTRIVLNPKDYIRYKLTGLKLTEVSDASGTGLFNVEKREFCWELIDKVGLRRELFPECVESDAHTGAVTPEAAALTGLPAGLTVTGGGGDAVIQTTGMGLVKQGVLGIIIGTSGVVAMGLDSFHKGNGDLQIFCNNARDLWHTFGCVMAAGGSYKWYRNTLCGELTEKAAAQGGSVYDLMNAEASQSPIGCRGVMFLPYLTGERCPYDDPNARGTFIGLSQLSTHGDMTRAVMEGVSYSFRMIADLIYSMGDDIVPSKIIASGGGASSPLWRQMLADIFGLPVYTLSGSAEGGAYGAALVAGVAVGVWKDLQDAIGVLDEESVTMPIAENTAEYGRFYGVYKTLYADLKPAFDRIAALQ